MNFRGSLKSRDSSRELLTASSLRQVLHTALKPMSFEHSGKDGTCPAVGNAE